MFRNSGTTLAVAALFILSPTIRGQEGAPETEYFPLKKGNTWLYGGPGNQQVEVKVTASQSLGKSTYFTLETRMFDKLVGKEDVTVNCEKEGEVEYLCVY